MNRAEQAPTITINYDGTLTLQGDIDDTFVDVHIDVIRSLVNQINECPARMT